jgi:chemotaxis protein histidine kinase CheA
MSGKTIRFEDLGEPVQRLLKSIKGGVSDEDMALLEFVSVKDMAKIYGEMSTDRQAKEIWEELRTALQARREKSDKKKAELDNRVEELEDQRRREEEAERAAEEQERLDREAEEEARRARKEDRRRRRAEAEAAAQAEEEEVAAAAAAAEQEAREEEERQAAEEAERKRRDTKRKKREARARELAEEQEALAAEQARSSKKKANQKKEWADYVASHPLDFPDGGAQNIEQVAVEKSTKPPPKITEDLLNRTYTPKCPNCSAKFSKPPTEWDCPLCLKRLKTKVKVWQPDDDSSTCLCCKGSIGRFSRHHCRNCGRLVCNKCCEHKALIPQIGYKDPVKVCNDCAGVGTPSS